jgi:hypothetical protein
MLTPEQAYELREDPLRFGRWLWPDVRFYDKQEEMIWSVWHNKETYVQAGTELGKDFTAAFIMLARFIAFDPCNIVYTSATERHLDVLDLEIDQFIRGSRIPLDSRHGGILLRKHRHIQRLVDTPPTPTYKVPYMKGVVTTNTSRGEGLSGHHNTFTMAVVDEASGVNDIAYSMMSAWADRILVFGNPHECSNFFYRHCEEGDVIAI